MVEIHSETVSTVVWTFYWTGAAVWIAGGLFLTTFIVWKVVDKVCEHLLHTFLKTHYTAQLARAHYYLKHGGRVPKEKEEDDDRGES